MTLDEYLADKKLTDKSFGEQIGVSGMQVGRYRRGLQKPTPEIAEKIIEKTGREVTLQDIYLPPA